MLETRAEGNVALLETNVFIETAKQVVSNDMSSVPSLAALDHTFLKWDKEWMFHKLPKDNIEIPRHHLPDPEAEAIPGTSKQIIRSKR
ncbi:hypothetical protein OESDEN_10228 [Oesophagostomum dentatum]|uniref:Uncharacterized protein n=1 Tax=Oesophagostomum dentatum TaxID=61180 RepID=A0A0B1T2B2_OESDE|nr:hypothetical protein OESDEN_10228 [Oesophagostomum dentatum]